MGYMDSRAVCAPNGRKHVPGPPACRRGVKGFKIAEEAIPGLLVEEDILSVGTPPVQNDDESSPQFERRLKADSSPTILVFRKRRLEDDRFASRITLVVPPTVIFS